MPGSPSPLKIVTASTKIAFSVCIAAWEAIDTFRFDVRGDQAPGRKVEGVGPPPGFFARPRLVPYPGQVRIYNNRLLSETDTEIVTEHYDSCGLRVPATGQVASRPDIVLVGESIAAGAEVSSSSR